jgi:quinoprotein glucose dehydrogenase
MRLALPSNWMARAIQSLLAALLLTHTATASSAQERRGWPAYQGGPDNIHYSTLSQVNRSNVKNLAVAWILDTKDPVPNREMYCNPLVIDGVIYVLSPKVNLIAADAATGRELWRFDPFGGRRVLGTHRIRGLSYWSDGKRGHIFFAARHQLYAIDAKTGKPVASFAQNGKIDLREHLDRDPTSRPVLLNTPGVVYEDLLIIGSTVSELLPAAYGDIRAYDVRTGRLRWTFHTIPRPGEFGYETWPKDTWKHTGGANAWSGLSLDERRGIVYAPTGSTTYDWYSADRAGDNLFANTLLALDAKTGKQLWHFQTVHHDSWDRDLPSPPSLVTVTRRGKRIDAVAQPTKTGHVFLFDRAKGTPLFPIKERAVSTQGALPGVRLSPTQPVPLTPEPFARQGFSEDMITDRTPEARASVLEKIKGMRSGEPFIPPSLEGTVMLPGVDGGAEWGGAAWDPESGLLYINSNDVPWYVQMHKREPTRAGGTGKEFYLRECSGCHGVDRQGSAMFPSLVGLGQYYDRYELGYFVLRGSGRMPSFSHLGRDTAYTIVDYVMTGEDTAVTAPDTHAVSSPYELSYTLRSIGRLQDHEGYPGVKPPWGTLSAINLNTGEYAWRIPLGEYPALAAKGIRDTGSENYGGAVVTAGGLLFIAATVPDRKFRAFDKSNGKLLWETILPASGHSTPAVYEVNGRQFVVIAAGGGKQVGINTENVTGATYIAFALPRNTLR